MQLDIFESGSVIGTLQIGQEGLYKSVDAQCSPKGEGVLRLYVWQGTKPVRFRKCLIGKISIFFNIINSYQKSIAFVSGNHIS